MAHNKYSTNKYEILAPAGSYECMLAAFNAGADAVYVGGQMFGARAFAGNFNTDELISAIDYAHIHGKKLFLTVNTLLKNQEITNELIEYIKPLYKAGLDAVIVQDFGVLTLIKENFPEMDIHASTQMTVTGAAFAKELKRLGVSRIVPARELSYAEIREIYDATGLEIECFVHGALCYCYSGMCLLSSLIGGRSGNRGRCAQPCRLPYDVQFEDKTTEKQYPLSPKDLCTLENLPQILEAGVYSLKIEGRMKKPEYVASVTAMYRKYVDLYEKKGKENYKVNEKDIAILKDIYNRGGFTTGYYERHNGSELMSTDRPNHMGTLAAKIICYDSKKGIIKAKAVTDIDSNDVLEIFTDSNKSVYVKLDSMKNGHEFTVNLRLPAKYSHIMRTRNNLLIDEIHNKYLSDSSKPLVSIGGSVVICMNTPILVNVWCDAYSVQVIGDIPQLASNRPVSEEDIRKQFLKTGGTEFKFDIDELTITVDNGLFVNIKEINRLRREALDKLQDKILQRYKRDYERTLDNKEIVNIKAKAIHERNVAITVLVSNISQFDAVMEIEKVDIIYAELDMISTNEIDKWDTLIKKAHKYNKKLCIALPYITRRHAKKVVMAKLEFFKSNDADGYVFRNMETVTLFDELGIECCMKVFDNTIYGFNNISLHFLDKYKPDIITASYELNKQELSYMDSDKLELCVYGYIPTMITAGCIKKTYGKCNQTKEMTILKDRMNNKIKVFSHCDFCYNIMYNSKPLLLADICDKKVNINYTSIRYNFVCETAKEIKDIMNNCNINDYTRGHYKRGVE